MEQEIRPEMNFGPIIGKSPALQRVLKEGETMGPTDSTVLIYRETGTGKELIAWLSSNSTAAITCAPIST